MVTIVYTSRRLGPCWTAAFIKIAIQEFTILSKEDKLGIVYVQTDKLTLKISKDTWEEKRLKGEQAGGNKTTKKGNKLQNT